MLAVLIGCGLRRGELLALTMESLQQREEHWVIVALGPRDHCVPVLFIAPIWTITGARSLRAGDGVSAQRHLWWARVSYLGTVAVGLLILWAFTPRPVWWVSWHWWLLGTAVVVVAIVSSAGQMFLTVHEVDAPRVRETLLAGANVGSRQASKRSLPFFDHMFSAAASCITVPTGEEPFNKNAEAA
jgi:hypothetical protein